MPNVSLNDYIALIGQANRSPLLSNEFTLITKEQFTAIQEHSTWQLYVAINPLDRDEINELKALNLLRGNILPGDYYKMFKLDVWQEMYKSQVEKKARRDEEVKLLCIIRERELQAITKLCQHLKMDYATSKVMLNSYILKGLMPDIARLLGVEDLVNK